MTLDEVMAVDQIGFPILSVLIGLPVVTSALLLFCRDRRLALIVAVTGAAIEVVLSALLALRFNHGVADTQFIERSSPVLGVSWHLGVDGLSLLFIPLIALLALLVILYAGASAKRKVGRYAITILTIEAAMMGAFVALDLVLFWLFFVIELVPSWFLITGWGTGPQRRRAAVEYVSFMAVGSVLMLVGILLLGRAYATTTGQGYTFELARLLEVDVPAGQQTLVFFLLFVGFAVKAPIFPFHTWMPRVLEHGPVVGISVFLVGVKLGAYGLIRFVIPLLPEAASRWFWLVALLGAVSTVYGALLALGQTNLRRLLAYASLAHMGVVLIGLFSLNRDGLEGGVLQMLNLGIVGAGLFFIAGFLTTRVGPPELDSLGGLINHAPVMTAMFLVIALAGVGLPGTNGFNGEHLIILGAYEQSLPMALVAGLGVLLTAAYSLAYFVRGFMGEARSAVVERVFDLTTSERGIVIVLAALIFWIGLGTGPFIQTLRPSVTILSDHIDAAETSNRPDVLP